MNRGDNRLLLSEKSPREGWQRRLAVLQTQHKAETLQQQEEHLAQLHLLQDQLLQEISLNMNATSVSVTGTGPGGNRTQTTPLKSEREGTDLPSFDRSPCFIAFNDSKSSPKETDKQGDAAPSQTRTVKPRATVSEQTRSTHDTGVVGVSPSSRPKIQHGGSVSHTPSPAGVRPQGSYIISSGDNHTPSLRVSHTPSPRVSHTPSPRVSHTPSPPGVHPQVNHTPSPAQILYARGVSHTPSPIASHPQYSHTPSPAGVPPHAQCVGRVSLTPSPVAKPHPQAQCVGRVSLTPSPAAKPHPQAQCVGRVSLTPSPVAKPHPQAQCGGRATLTPTPSPIAGVKLSSQIQHTSHSTTPSADLQTQYGNPHTPSPVPSANQPVLSHPTTPSADPQTSYRDPHTPSPIASAHTSHPTTPSADHYCKPHTPSPSVNQPVLPHPSTPADSPADPRASYRTNHTPSPIASAHTSHPRPPSEYPYPTNYVPSSWNTSLPMSRPPTNPPPLPTQTYVRPLTSNAPQSTTRGGLGEHQLSRASLVERHAKHILDLKAYYESELGNLSDKLAHLDSEGTRWRLKTTPTRRSLDFEVIQKMTSVELESYGSGGGERGKGGEGEEKRLKSENELLKAECGKLSKSFQETKM